MVRAEATARNMMVTASPPAADIMPGPQPRLFSWRAIGDRRSLLQGGKCFFNGEQNGRLKGAQGSAGADGDRRGRHRDVIRSFPQVVAIVIAEGVPEAVKLSADRFDVLHGRGPAILGILDQPCPRLGRVAEPGEIHRHRFSSSRTISVHAAFTRLIVAGTSDVVQGECGTLAPRSVECE